MFQSVWFRVTVFISSIIVVVFITFEVTKKPPEITKPDECLLCHVDINNIGISHPVSIFGCSKCHGGNPYATNKATAHQGIVLNPARLNSNAALRYCSKCHADIIKRVKNSIMNTMTGVINDTNYQLGFSNTPFGRITISDLKRFHSHKDLPIKYVRKMCAACHINQLQSIFPKNMIRGGGCVDCHAVKNKKNHHVTLTTRIPSRNCIKCHNRSGRIGLSYYGRFETPGYGTPYKNGDFSHRIKVGKDRYYYNLPMDIHAKAHLTCIDCHTSVGIMGNGKVYARMWFQEDIECIDCHKPIFFPPNSLAEKLAFLNGKIHLSNLIAYTHRFHTPLYNVQKINGKVYFYYKQTGKRIPMPIMSNKPYHTLPFHKRLSCQACHSSWAPSCYGCHVAEFRGVKQFDWISHMATKPAFREFSSFYRHSIVLAFNYKGKIMPVVPGCQTFVTEYRKGKVVKQFHKITYAPIAPHTTQLKTRSCAACHINPITLGLGRGTLHVSDGKVLFIPIFDSEASGFGIKYPLDALESINGKAFVKMSMPNERPFNKKELHNIIFAYRCIICHDKYSDPIYKHFHLSTKLFNEGLTPCSRE